MGKRYLPLFPPLCTSYAKLDRNISEGQSAFDNVDEKRIPHKEVNGEIVFNQRKNGDKYTRQYWDKVPPCVHTRNDILASQNTVHPTDNRVFSIREIMLMMSVPYSFEWSEIPFEILDEMSWKDKKYFIRRSVELKIAA